MIIFEWSKIEHKNEKFTGSAKLKCPACIDSRKNKADRSLYVRYDSGVAKCFHCEALSFRENISKQTESKNYTLPAQTWKNYTALSDALVKHFEARGIKQFTLNEMGVSEEIYYQPQLQKEVNNIVFNYFEGEILVNKKYRSSNKKFTQSKNGKPIFYNINSVIGKSEAFIVEGEIDCLTLHQEGFKSVVSVPNGANDNDAYWINSEPYLKDVQKFYIGTDNDAKGNELAEKIAQRLGRYRCERINWKGKDANDDLLSGVLEKSIFNRDKYPVSGTFTVTDSYDEIIGLYDNGLPETIYPKHKCFGRLKEIFSVMRGHLVVSTGIPSHGKSNFTEWYVLNLIKDYGMKASFFSPEHHPLALHHTNFIQKTFAKNFFREVNGTPRISKIEIAKYHDWIKESLYLTCPDNNEFPTWDWLFDKFHEQMFSYGVDIFVIDAFNKLEFSEKGNKLDLINKTLSRLTMFAQMNNVIIFLIAHPTKMKQNEKGVYSMPTLYDVSGSADFRNQTHDGYCIYRYFGDNEGGEEKTTFVNLKTKFQFQGEMGKSVDFEYHLPSGRYYEKGTEPPTHSLIDDNTKLHEFLEEVAGLPLTSPTDAFGDNYNEHEELPF